MSNMIGTDGHATSLIQTLWGGHRNRSFSDWHYHCTCPHWIFKKYKWREDAQVRAEVHARLWHDYEPDRTWRR